MDIGADLFLQMMQRVIENGNLYVKFMDTVLEAIQATYAREGSDETLNEIHAHMSDHLLEMYHEIIGKYLAAPQFGIPRETIQQINSAITAYHKFLGTAGDFLIMFSTPLKKSMDHLQQAIKDKERTNEGFKSAKEAYNFTVNILDKAYDDWLKSPEGVQSVVNLVNEYLDYRKKLNPVRDSWLKSLSIPTKREMEDVYRGIYDLKKKTRQQDAIIREQNMIIKTLTRKLQTMEDSLSGVISKKKPSASSNV
jgi:class III poly(R)-hydroxyalkanoic acid synthase PhaE subunit